MPNNEPQQESQVEIPPYRVIQKGRVANIAVSDFESLVTHHLIAYMKTQDALDTPVARSMEQLGQPVPDDAPAQQVATFEPAVHTRQMAH